MNFISIAVVAQSWNNIGPSVYMFTVALLCSMMESNFFCLADPCWWLELRSSNFNVSSVWFLNLFGIKVLISSLPKIYKPQLGNFCEKLFQRRALICLQNKKLFYRTIVGTYFDFLELVIFLKKWHIHIVLFESCILNSVSSGQN